MDWVGAPCRLFFVLLPLRSCGLPYDCGYFGEWNECAFQLCFYVLAFSYLKIRLICAKETRLWRGGSGLGTVAQLARVHESKRVE